ncbi:hypothetical protein [Kutzneria kofuensis]|uniref:Uncharacterized protein n=1 Tax=Kutzneria kofuensis TaxID=103725 RepID=A0A7W9KS39_9PSEU|nr:hypothetical protein [Kutzneria kofuensis]MBB5897625.1 hypothetical protein [Kutzneria kofuensis]
MRRAIASVALGVALTAGLSAVPAQAATVAPAGSAILAGDSADIQSAVDEIRALVPDLESRAAAAGVPASDAVQVVRQLINPGDYDCPASTPLQDWLRGTLQGLNQQQLGAALTLLLLDVVTWDSRVNDPQDPAVYGPAGEFTIPVTHTFKDLRRFWDIDSNGVLLVPMHGSVMVDKARMTRVFQVVYGASAANAARLADLVAQLVRSVPQFNGGDFPLFTFNSYATSAEELGGRRIAMGDGVLAGYAAIGLGDVAPQAILAHEYGHQVQFADDLIGSETSPEASRRVELMADAFSAYFLSHARGAAMQTKRVTQFLGVYYNVGDCGFASLSHHGTPAQRQRTGEWAYSVADSARPQGFILPSPTFGRMFDAELPVLVAPDAS